MTDWLHDQQTVRLMDENDELIEYSLIDLT